MKKQRKWQKGQVKAGNCAQCGQPRGAYAVYCDEHALAVRRRVRKRGSQPWKPGGRGRKPFIAEVRP